MVAVASPSSPSSVSATETKDTVEKTTDASKAADPAADAAPAEMESVVLKDLLILPPLNKTSDVANASEQELLDAVPLPPIRSEEPVSSLRTALSEVCGYAHLTNYRLQLVPKALGVQRKEITKGKTPKDQQESLATASIYTGKAAVVSVPAVTAREGSLALSGAPAPSTATSSSGTPTKEGTPVVLDDFGDLTMLLEDGLTDGSAFRIVLERYDAAAVRDHVVRLRSLLDGNAPTVTSFVDDSKKSPVPAKENDSDVTPVSEADDPAAAATGANGEDKKVEDPDKAKEKAKAEAAKKQEELASKASAKLPHYDINTPVGVDGKNLKDFFYLVCGEDPNLYHGEFPSKSSKGNQNGAQNGHSSPTHKKKKGKNRNKSPQQKDQKSDTKDQDEEEETPMEEMMRTTIPRLNALEETTRVPCSIRFSGYHPPPPHRKLMGDLAYLEVSLEGQASIFITAVSTGFYVNRSSRASFDPAPAADSCFSHELLDCLLKIKTSKFAKLWADAVAASKERAEFMNSTNKDGPFSSLFRVAVRGDFDGYTNLATASPYTGIDALLQTPSWVTPLPHSRSKNGSAASDWKHYSQHSYNLNKTEDDLSSTFGVDIRGGAVRDWNEELQSAREMPTSTLQERIERARILHKVLTDFGEASVLGVKAIMEGQISAMNPNEAARSQVFLHNNIFFSRAVDAGIETFKIAKGDKAARKSASRDIQCIGTLHRMDTTELHTLATVLIDYLGTRYVCQSILPGILSGDKTHTLLYGAVEAGCQLKFDKEMHDALENTVGKTLQVATRKIPRQPLTPERLEEIKLIKSTVPAYLHPPQPDTTEEDKDLSPTIDSCAPLEAKGIRGSDQRKYLLDISRLTPRDANWVPKEQGGTGLWEELQEKSGKAQSKIPTSLDDDEWTLAVLRPELVTRYVKVGREKWLKSITEKDKEKMEAEGEKKDTEAKPDKAQSSEGKEDASDTKPEDQEKPKEKKPEPRKLTDEEVEHLKTFRINVNVFLPEVMTLEGVDTEAAEQQKADEERAREAARMLWDQILPRLTLDIREASGPHQQLPADGRSLTEMLHQHGINCRYLGRLAMLAQKEEDQDKAIDIEVKNGNVVRLGRRKMPLYWLEMLETEMVARAAKHVLESYLTENGGAAATQPAQTIASFLSALVSESEETAAQTETRMAKKKGGPDEDDFNALTLCDTGGDGDAVPGTIRSRTDVWEDIQREVGRRFRYSLTLYNSGGRDSRALYIPLLRRVCQRTGVRLIARNYDVGGKCLCSGGNTAGGRMTASYPIEPTDVADIVPLMKHAAAHVEGFVPCAIGQSIGLPPLHISLPDTRTTLEAAHLHCNARSLSPALDLAQEAASLYQRVTDTPAHPGVVRCMDLMATILFEAGEPVLAANSAIKGLGLLVQVSGFDSFDSISAHLLLFQMLMTAHQLERGVKHLRAALYLMETLAGPHYIEHSNVYHKLGTIYHGAGNVLTALRFYQEAGSRAVSDRLHEGMIMRSTSMVLAAIGQLKLAVQTEKKAYQKFSLMFGEEHNLTKASDATLKNFMKAAVDQGNRMALDDKKRKEEQAAAAMASQMEADEEAEEKKKKKNSKKKKGKK